MRTQRAAELGGGRAGRAGVQHDQVLVGGEAEERFTVGRDVDAVPGPRQGGTDEIARVGIRVVEQDAAGRHCDST
jgi:hypothetical protein